MIPPVEARGPFERHVMPSGPEVFYRDSDHSYWGRVREKKGGEWGGVKDARLAGVTTVVAPFDWRADNLMRWAARSNGAGIAALAADALCCQDAGEMRSMLAWLSSADAIWDALVEARMTYEHLRDDAATRGTNVHKHALHALATGRPVPDLAALTEEERGYARGVMAFWHEHEPQPLQSEFVVCDPGLRVAGRPDLRCVIDGENVLVDAKTGGYIGLTAHAQLAGYERCARLSGYGESRRQVILQVDGDGGYRLIPVRATAGDFEAVVGLYRRAAAIDGRARADRKALGKVAA